MRIRLMVGTVLACLLLTAGSSLALIEVADIATGVADSAADQASAYAQGAPQPEGVVNLAGFVATQAVLAGYQVLAIEMAAVDNATLLPDYVAAHALAAKNEGWDCAVGAADDWFRGFSFPPQDPALAPGAACAADSAIGHGLQTQALAVFLVNQFVEA